MLLRSKYKIIFSFFIMVGLLISVRPTLSLDSISETNTEEQFQETKEFFLTETEEGKKKWDIKALSAEFSSDGIVHLNKVKINLYEDEGRVLNIKADRGRFDNINKNVHLEGNVIGITDRGESFTTQSLDWISAKEKIETSDKIKITGQNLVINAKGLIIYPELKKIILKKDIKAEVYGEKEAFPLNFGR